VADLTHTIKRFQDQLLGEIEQRAPALSPRVIDAFYSTPRHLFAEQYGSWAHGQYCLVTVDASNLEAHLPAIYRDEGLGIFGEDLATSVTMSMPSFVLEMLELLQLEPGHRVFELGTGSGWNAALVAHLVGPDAPIPIHTV
jgi:protein-L-isoaspartate(D-aspartate) O-methyltransferase